MLVIPNLEFYKYWLLLCVLPRDIVQMMQSLCITTTDLFV